MGLDARADDATLVLAARAGDLQAFPALFERWFDRAHGVTQLILAEPTDQATAVAEAFEHAWLHLVDLDPPAFGPVVLRAARRLALDQLEAGATPFPVMGRAGWFRTRQASMAEDRLVASTTVDQAADDPEITDLVRSASAVFPAAERSLLDLQLRYGVPEADLALDSGEAVHDVEQRLFRLRARFRTALETAVLWRGGRPTCTGLATALRQVSQGRFDLETAAAIADHAEACAQCRADKRLQLAPASLFAALPVADTGTDVRALVVERLTEGGVPAEAPPVEADPVEGEAAGAGLTAVGGAPASSDAERARSRRQVGLILGGAVAAVAALLLGLQPWRSSHPEQVGVLGGASESSAPAAGAIDPSTTTTTPSTGHHLPTTTTTSTTTEGPSSSTNTTEPSTTTTQPTSSTSTAAPLITSATALGGAACTSGSGTDVAVTWATQNADSVTVSGGTPDSSTLPTSGTTHVCVAELPTVLTVSATGAGGTTSQELTVSTSTTTTTSSSTTTTTSTTRGANATAGGGGAAGG